MRKGYGKYTVWSRISNIHDNISKIISSNDIGAWRGIKI